MSDPEDKWPLPNYDAGSPKHLHALGVIALTYSEFESQMFALFKHHFELNNIPSSIPIFCYSTWDSQKRLAATVVVFSAYEKDKDVIYCINRLKNYFLRCAEIRNNLMHSEYAPPLFGGSAEYLYLQKYSKKRTHLNYAKPTLQKLRYIAEAMKAGSALANELWYYLKLRDTPEGKRSVTLRAIAGLVSEKPPSIPAPPRNLKLHQIPHTPPPPPHLRRS